MLHTSTLVTTKLYFNAGSSLDPVDPPAIVLCLHIHVGNLAHASHMYVHVHVCVLIINFYVVDLTAWSEALINPSSEATRPLF